MKKIALLTLSAALVSPVSYSTESFQAKLHSIEVYEGDKGGENSCEKEHILVTEKYEIFNTELSGMILGRYSSNVGLRLQPMRFRSKEGSFLQFDVCTSRQYKDDVVTRFMKPDGDVSNEIKFTVNVNGMTVKPAAGWGRLIPNK